MTRTSFDLPREDVERVGWWLAGALLGLLLVGPAWSGDALLNLDLVVFDRIPVSSGLWGLGPELPRQSPAISALAVLSVAVPGPFLVAITMIGCVASAFVGMQRLTKPACWHGRLAAALLYAASPWLATRLAVGHLGLAIAAALLPWLLPTLLHPNRDLARTTLACAALCLGGFFGGTLSLLVLVVALLADRCRGAVRVGAAWTVVNLPWIVPGIIVSATAPAPAGGAAFRTTVDSWGDAARLVLGYGFWQNGNQLGLASAIVPGAAVAVVAVAALGARQLVERFGSRIIAVAGAALVVTLAGSIPVLRSVFDAATSFPPGSVFREAQRTLVLFLACVSGAVAFGIDSLRERGPLVARASSVAVSLIALAIVGPAMWGLGGRTNGVDVPDSWASIQSRIAAEPGTTLALPWTQYLDVGVADGRRTYHPVNVLAPGDVLNSSDPELGSDVSEAADPRESAIGPLIAGLDIGTPISGDLDRLGVRWVVVLRGVSDARYDSLGLDRGLELVIEDPTIALYSVIGWDTPIRPAAEISSPLAPIGFLGDAPRDAVWSAPGSRGWVRGTDAATITPDGLLRLEGTSSILWYWPALIALGGHALAIAATALSARSLRRRGADESSREVSPSS